MSKPPGYWTKEKIIEAIRLFESRNRRPPRIRDWFNANDDYPNFSTPKEAFGSFGAAIEAAGFKKRPKGRPGEYFDKQDQILLDIQIFVQERGFVPTQRHNERLARAAEVQFGSWGKAIRAAGFEPRIEGSHAVGKVYCPNCQHEFEVA